MKDNSEELRRILEMVESGQISAADGAKLLASTQQAEAAESLVCPYCAESISIRSGHCPECGSNLDAPVNPPMNHSHGFQALSGLGKFLVVYTLLVTGFGLVSTVLSDGMHLTESSLFGGLLALLGLLAGIHILRGKPIGWSLGIIWSALQIVTVILRGQIINQQVFHLGANFHTNGQGFGINLVGIVLLVLFIKAKSTQPCCSAQRNHIT
jgi:hypothetical protein